MRLSSIDLGTNTCLLLIAEWDAERGLVTEVIEDHAHVVRLGEGVDQARAIQPEPAERALRCLKLYAHRVRQRGIEPAQTIAVATSQARDSSNAHEFFARVERETGFRFRTLSGAEEAQATFAGALGVGADPARSAVIDIGGGSTEIRSQASGASLDIGSVRLSERCFAASLADRHRAVTDDEFWRCRAEIDAALAGLSPWRATLPEGATLIAVAGTATTLAAQHLGLAQFDAPRIDRCRLVRGDVHRLVEELKMRTTHEREQLPGVEPGRADVLLAGALILWRTLECLDFPQVAISTRGLRYGVLSFGVS